MAQNEQANPAVDFLRETLEINVRNDLLDQLRDSGMIISEQAKAQATMVAEIAVRAVLRRINVVRLTTEQPNADIRKYNEAGKEKGINFYDDVVLSEIADAVGRVVTENKFLSIEEQKGLKSTKWHTQLILVPPNAFEVPVPAAEPKKPSSLILPPGMR